MKTNKLSTLVVLLSTGLLAMTLEGCLTTTTKEGWKGKNGFSQWHPQTGSSNISSTGTQCYFCPEDDKAKPVDSDGDGVFDDKDKCPNTPKGAPVDAKGCIPDTDADGVTDDKDKCPDTLAGARVNELGCWVLENLHFDTNKSVIKSEYNPILNSVLSVLKNNPNVRVEIQGHTDNVGSKALNDKLSNNRAKAVMDYLTSFGIPAKQLSSVGYGAAQPIASNDTPEGRAKNRRVELKTVR